MITTIVYIFYLFSLLQGVLLLTPVSAARIERLGTCQLRMPDGVNGEMARLGDCDYQLSNPEYQLQKDMVTLERTVQKSASISFSK